jgi:phosphatidate cytidylyltransferase
VPQRVLSVAILIPLIVGCVYWGVWPVALLTTIGAVVGLTELYRALHQAGYHPRFVVGIGMALLFCAAAALHTVQPFPWAEAALAASLLLVLIAELPRHNHEHSLASWTLTFALACYAGWLLSHYVLLRQIATPLSGGWLDFLQIAPGAAWVYLVLALTWADDSAAYFVGRRWGRHKMAPALSPHKSWEGAIAGFVAAVLAALLSVAVFGLPLTPLQAIVIGAAGGISGQLGDLAESLIKRQIGIKDSSNLIPGHGGVLDRIDSMLFSAPTVYYTLILLTVVS